MLNGGQWEVHAAKLTSDTAVSMLAELFQAERDLEQAKQRRDKQRQRELERRIHNLCASLAQDWPHAFYAYLKAIDSPSSNILREEWRAQLPSLQPSNGLKWLRDLEIERPLRHSLGALPCYAFALEFQFVLAKPYLSQDDDAFYVIDNPVRKDRVLDVPYVAPTGWKGSLRAAAMQRLLDTFAGMLADEPPAGEAERGELLAVLWTERARRVVLFGNEKENDAAFLNRRLASRLVPEQSGEDERERERQVKEEANRLGEAFKKYLIECGYRTEKIEGRQGRLFCFPTFFNQIGLEIINPHDQKRRVGKNPILFECVPVGARGTFRLLYVPYDFPGEVTPNESALRGQVQADLSLMAEAVCDLFTVYGFGAKTSSGFGIAEDQLAEAGQLIIRVPPETLSKPEITFRTLSELCKVAQQVADELRKGGAS